MKVKSKGARLAVLAALFMASTAQAANALTIDVHRDANCGCCKKWISHPRQVASLLDAEHSTSSLTVGRSLLGQRGDFGGTVN